MTPTRRGALALPALLLAPAARAQEWRPSQPIRIVVPAAPGGTTDIMARLAAAHLQPRLGVNAVVENRSGGGGTIGTMEVVRAAADGHTLLSGNIGPQAIAYSLFRNLPYTPASLAPVANMIRGPNVLVVHPAVPARTVPELVEHLRRNPGRLSYGSPGVGQSPHLSGVWFGQLTRTDAIHVPFRGAGPAAMELVAGNIQFMFDNLTSGIEQIRGNRVRPLAVTSTERNPQLPDIPALRETMPELAEYEVNSWFGLFAPAATPTPAIATLNREVQALLTAPETRARFSTMGGEPMPGSPAEFDRFVRAETAKWRQVIEREGLQIDVS